MHLSVVPSKVINFPLLPRRPRGSGCDPVNYPKLARALLVSAQRSFSGDRLAIVPGEPVIRHD